MTITELLNTITELNKQVYCNGQSIRVHKIKSTVRFVLKDESREVFELDSISLDYLDGCRCPCGITFNLKNVEPDVNY